MLVETDTGHVRDLLDSMPHHFANAVAHQWISTRYVTSFDCIAWYDGSLFSDCLHGLHARAGPFLSKGYRLLQLYEVSRGFAKSAKSMKSKNDRVTNWESSSQIEELEKMNSA